MIKATEPAAQALSTLHLDRSTVVLVDVSNQFQHLCLLVALGLMGVPSASVQSRLGGLRRPARVPVDRR